MENILLKIKHKTPLTMRIIFDLDNFEKFTIEKDMTRYPTRFQSRFVHFFPNDIFLKIQEKDILIENAKGEKVKHRYLQILHKGIVGWVEENYIIDLTE
jgi:hypothetical protein